MPDASIFGCLIDHTKMTFHRVLTAYLISQRLLYSEIVEWLKQYFFPFVPDLYQVSRSQVQVPITPDQVQPKYWSMDSKWWPPAH